jgi:5-methylcytosine-specific restriction protein A
MQCRATHAGGYRMIADHIVERKDGGAALDPNNGQCLCVAHNTLKGNQARRARFLAGP